MDKLTLAKAIWRHETDGQPDNFVQDMVTGYVYWKGLAGENPFVKKAALKIEHMIRNYEPIK